MKIFTTLILLLVNSICFGQKSIEGSFYYSEDFIGISLILDKNNAYKYIRSINCLSYAIDTGIYTVNGDTIIFNSIYKEEDLSKKDIGINAYYDILPRSFYVDSFECTISNNTGDLIDTTKIFLNEKLVKIFDRIDSSGNKVVYKFPVKMKSKNVNIKITLKNLENEILNTNAGEFLIFTNSSEIKEPITGTKMYYKNDIIYPFSCNETQVLKRDNR